MSEITVVLPTFKRTRDLERCLAAIDAQLLRPAEILLTYRADDEETRAYLARTDRPGLSARLLLCNRPGVVYALTVAFDNVRTKYLAITDDDAVPHADWLQRIVAHFDADAAVGAVGGKDHVYAVGRWWNETEPVVGRVPWHGVVIGNHHAGFGSARHVETLKGVNMAIRTSALADLRPDTRLRGKGAQVGWEMHLTFGLLRAGYKVIYDPLILVDHYPGTRPLEEDRVSFNPTSLSDEVFNRTLTVLEFLAVQRWSWLRQFAFMAYLTVRGTKKAPGVLLLAYGIATGYPHTWERFKAALVANRDAWLASRRLT